MKARRAASRSAPRAAPSRAKPQPKPRPRPRAPRVTFELAVDDEVRGAVPWRGELAREARRMLAAAARYEGALALEASARLTDDLVIHQLNRDFRDKDKPTDVLAFAQREGPWAGVGAELLGDIVISLPTARRQAKRKTAAGVHHEVRFLLAHGLCHLLGYDHQDDDQEREMNARMASLLAEAARKGPVRAA